MTVGQIPRPGAHPPEWVGEGDFRRNIAGQTDRGVAAMALDAVLHVAGLMRTHSSEFLEFKRAYEQDKVVLLKELPDHERRIAALENNSGGQHGDRPSSHEWDEMLVNAGRVLSQRVKDPRDKMDSSRARKIAEEVIESAKTADDAKAFRSLKTRGQKLAWSLIKLLIAALAGGGATHWGLHRGH